MSKRERDDEIDSEEVSAKQMATLMRPRMEKRDSAEWNRVKRLIKETCLDMDEEEIILFLELSVSRASEEYVTEKLKASGYTIHRLGSDANATDNIVLAARF